MPNLYKLIDYRFINNKRIMRIQRNREIKE